MTPESYCASKAALPDSDRQLALIFIHAEHRAPIEAILALDAELHEIRIHMSDPAIAQARLEWWRQELEQARTGDPQHPVTRRFAELDLFSCIAPEYLEEMCEAVETDLQANSFATFSKLMLYCYRRSGVLFALIWSLTGDTPESHWSAMQHIGSGVLLSELLSTLGTHAAAGHVYIAHEDMQRYEIRPQALVKKETDAALHALLDDYSSRAQTELDKGISDFDTAPVSRQNFGLISAALARKQLQHIRGLAYPKLHAQPRAWGPSRAWTAWRAARGHLWNTTTDKRMR